MRRLFVGLAILTVLGFVLPAQAQDQRCFPETSQCISGRIRQYWERNGGLPVFGFPTTDQHEELVEGQPFQVQWFERNRLELHPENAPPYDVLLGRLGADRLQQQGRDWFTFPKGSEQPNCRHFTETGHTVCGDFLAYFRSQGLDLSQGGTTEAESLALFGLPLSEAADETSPTDDKTYLTQHFERARMELHPENQPPFNVLLGLLGNEIRNNAVLPPPQPRPLPPPSFNACQDDPNRDAAPNYPVQIVTVDKDKEVVILKNVSDAAIDLGGWHMCSIRGNQEHPISGTLAPGEQKPFPGPEGSVWSDNDDDNGALYNPQGQLVSYWKDPRDSSPSRPPDPKPPRPTPPTRP
jgi:hypothetical protein